MQVKIQYNDKELRTTIKDASRQTVKKVKYAIKRGQPSFQIGNQIFIVDNIAYVTISTSDDVIITPQSEKNE